MKHTDVISSVLVLEHLADLPEDLGMVAWLSFELRCALATANRPSALRRWAMSSGGSR